MVKIKKVKWGCANAYPKQDLIELHEDLDNFPILKRKIIKHEIEHINSKSKGFFKQRKIDTLTELKFKDVLPFYKKNPKAFFQQHFPITYRDNILYFEWSLLFLYSCYLIVGTIIFLIIKTFSNDSIIFWRIILYAILLLILCAFIYYCGKQLVKYLNKQAKKVE